MDVHGDCPVLQSIYLGRYSFEGTKDGAVSKESNLVLLSRIRKATLHFRPSRTAHVCCLSKQLHLHEEGGDRGYS